MKREHVLRLAHRISDIACGNEDRVDLKHDPATCDVCCRIADMLIDFFTPDPDPLAAPASAGAMLPPCGCGNPDMCLDPSPGVTCAAGLIPDSPAVAAPLREPLDLWIVTEYDGGGIRGVFLSQRDAETEIAAIRSEHPDLTRSDFVIQVQRVRAALASVSGTEE